MPRTSDFDHHALYLALDARRVERGLSWGAVAREITARGGGPVGRLSRATLTGLPSRRFVEGDGVLAMLRWLDRTPESFMDGVVEPDAPHYRLPSAPGKVLRFDTITLHAALDTTRQSRGLTWEELARQISGASATGLQRLGERLGRIGFPQVGRLTRWLDQPTADFVRAADW
jgi:hypothetical protein